MEEYYNKQPDTVVAKVKCPRKRERRRIVGMLLLVIAAAALVFDTFQILGGLGLANVSGIMHIWMYMNHASFDMFNAFVVARLGDDAWNSVMIPLMKIPVALLLGLPGFLLMRGNHREIKARAPSLMDLELARSGQRPQRRTR